MQIFHGPTAFLDGFDQGFLFDVEAIADEIGHLNQIGSGMDKP